MSINSFNPKLQPYIREILLSGKLGVSLGHMQIKDVLSGSSANSIYYKQGDRFKLCVPYAGQNLEWEVLFNNLMPSQPPEFGFDDTSFLSNPDIAEMERNVPSLASWNYCDSLSLLKVINELVALYRRHQVELLQNSFSRLQFEYTSLIGEANIDENNIEVFVSTPANSSRCRMISGPVYFLIRLSLNFSGLQPMRGFENPGEDSANLLVTFHPPEGCKITTELWLSPRVESALGITITLPQFPPDSGLMDYVPQLTNDLQDKITTSVKNFESRKELIAVMHYCIGNSIIEYDNVTFLKASFLLERREFYFIVSIDIPQSFPAEMPSVVLQSVYNYSGGKPYKFTCKDYPYSPRWKPLTMFVKFYNFLMNDFVDKFQATSVKS